MLRHPQSPAQLGDWLVGQKGASRVKMLEQKGTGSLQALKAVRLTWHQSHSPPPNAESQAFTRCFHFSQCLKGLCLHPGQNTVHCFPRLQQPYPADQPGLFLCFVVASLLCYTYSNFSSALNVALLQQLIISRHRGVYSWADCLQLVPKAFTAIPRLNRPSWPGTPCAKLGFTQQVPTRSWDAYRSKEHFLSQWFNGYVFSQSP